jgi:diaminobutyrate-2-oxoglutarate transaminase
MVWGLDIPRGGFAGEVSKEAFDNKLIIELAGADDNVVKFLPALTIEEETLREGMELIDKAIGAVLERSDLARKGGSAA